MLEPLGKGSEVKIQLVQPGVCKYVRMNSEKRANSTSATTRKNPRTKNQNCDCQANEIQRPTRAKEYTFFAFVLFFFSGHVSVNEGNM